MMKLMLTNLFITALLLPSVATALDKKTYEPTKYKKRTREPTESPTAAPTKPATIFVIPSKMDFGKRFFNVEYYHPRPTKYDWIGIFSRSDKPSDKTSLLSSDLCGQGKKKMIQEEAVISKEDEELGKKSKCYGNNEGSVLFSVAGADLNALNKMPLNPGKYKACLMYYKKDSKVCSNFEVAELPRSVIRGATLKLDQNEFGYGHDVSTSYSISGNKLPINSWIGVYDANKVNNSSSRLPAKNHAWAYAGCNNKNGNNSAQKSCTIRSRFGVVDKFDGLIPVGTHRFCLSFFSNSPFTAFVCSQRTFTVVTPTLDIEPYVPFGSDINLVIDNDYPSTYNWVAILDNTSKKKEELWASMCEDQDSWNKLCPEMYQGTVSFNSPVQESYKKWPIRPGQKTACMYGTAKDENLKLVCKDFVVEEIDPSVLSGTSLMTYEDRFEFGEAITARFDTPTAFANTWIGVYSASEISNNMSKLPDKKPKVWVYSSCSNKEGEDQTKSDSCVEKKLSDVIKIDSTDINPGTYYLCMNFYNNPPYTKFKCSEKTFFVQKPVCEDNREYTFTLRDNVTTENCRWINQPGISESQRYNRYKNWCKNKKSDVRANCKASCGLCPECKNEKYYTWKIFDGSKRSCDFIDDESITQEQADFRLSRWCDPSRPDNKLLECPKACNECFVPTPAPTREQVGGQADKKTWQFTMSATKSE